MKKILVGILVMVLAVALALPATLVSAAPDTVDFDGLTTGDSVIGLGNAGHVDLDIQSTSPDDLVIIEEHNSTYHVYSGNNLVNNDTYNAGLTGGKGFGDPDRNDAQLGWEATFNGKTVSSFSIDMLDYGDWFSQMANYDGVKTHTAALIAYDSFAVELGRSTLTFHSTGVGSTSRNSPEYGFLGDTGDVLEAAGGNTNPGLWTFDLTFSGIYRVEMWFDGTDSADPGVGWDNIVFELEELFPTSLTSNLCAGQNIEVGNIIVDNDGIDLTVTYEITDLDWIITETHLEVVEDTEDFPTTKKGNPIPGHFTWSDDHDPAVDTFTYTVPLADIGDGVDADNPVYIAAHAVVVKAEQEETAWGDGCGGQRFTERGNWATYFTYTVQYTVQEEPTLEGEWLLDVNNGAYMHDMFIVTQSSTGELSGTGGYQAGQTVYEQEWVLTGQVDGTTVTIIITYLAGPRHPYTTTLTGTIDSDWNSMDGTGTSGVSTWLATRVP
ncbi:hypothetical protein ACFLW4_05525 [Chloroflexota bacterium]